MSGKKIFLALSGGIGNQLFQIAAAYALTGVEDKIYLDFQLCKTTSEEDSVYQNWILPSRFINLELPKPGWFVKKIINVHWRMISDRTFALILICTIFKPILKRLITKRSGQKVEIVLDDKRYAGLELKHKNNLMIGYFQYIPLSCTDLYSDFKSNLQLKKPSNELKEYISALQSSPHIFVHVRLGDYINEKKFGNLSLEYFIKALETLEKYSGGIKLLIFSNDIAQCKLFFTEAEQGRIVEYFATSNLTPNETLELMRYGTHYVLSNSTYGWWSAFLSHSRSPKVYVPDPWFQDIPYSAQLLPLEWNNLKNGTRNDWFF
jgi:hypothetical protein